MVRKIRAVVEMGRSTQEEFIDLPEGWDEMSEAEQAEELTEYAVTLQNNFAPCSAQVVEVED